MLGSLKLFARKERAWVVQFLTGSGSQMSLHDEPRTKLGDLLGLDIPADAYLTIDYHFDWMIGALHHAAGHEEPFSNDDGAVRGNQEDCDVVIAWNDGAHTQVVLVEAKGIGAWTGQQLTSKLQRVQQVRDLSERLQLPVTWRLCLLSPKPPSAGHASALPGLDAVLHLPLPLDSGFMRVERCTPDGKASASGTHARVRPT